MNANVTRVPGDAVGLIRECVREGRIYWTYHVNMRIKDRFIPRTLIVDAIEDREIIESYPNDKYLPSYLVWLNSGENIVHVLFAVDVDGNNVRIVTAYRPDPIEWDDNRKRRKVI